MKTCKTCRWHRAGDLSSEISEYVNGGYCHCPKIYERCCEPDGEIEYSKDHMVYSYNEDGGFWTGDDFGCIHYSAMRILHLTVKRKWFDLIASGEKTDEFRECKPYWEQRLLHGPDGEPNEYDEVHLRNGYRKDSPFMRVKCNGLTLSGRKWLTPKHGEVLAESVIVVHLGPVLELRM